MTEGIWKRNLEAAAYTIAMLSDRCIILEEELRRLRTDNEQLKTNANTREVIAQVAKEKDGSNYALINVEKRQMPKRSRDGKFLPRTKK